jgi:hypothetical protein
MELNGDDVSTGNTLESYRNGWCPRKHKEIRSSGLDLKLEIPNMEQKW